MRKRKKDAINNYYIVHNALKQEMQCMLSGRIIALHLASKLVTQADIINLVRNQQKCKVH